MSGIAAEAIHKHGALQDEWEMATMLQLVHDYVDPMDHDYVDPMNLVEIGSHTGGSLYAWQKATSARVLAVTLTRQDLWNSWGAIVIEGDSTNRRTQQAVFDALNGSRPEVVFVDGGHDEFTCRSDIDFATQLIVEGLIIVHDINLHIRFRDSGVRRVWDQVRHRFPSMEIVNKPNEDPGVGLLWIR